MAGEYSLTNANILAAGSGATGYQEWTIKDDANREWNAYAIKNKHSNATADKHYLQIKKYSSNTAYYIQIPDLGEQIKSITMTVSGASKPMDGGSNAATLFFSASESTDAEGTGVASGTGSSSVTIDASDLGLTTGYITAGGGVRIWDIVVTTGAAASVAKPTFTPETAEFENEVSVSLACETEGAEIFYTLDGTAPTAESAKYEAAFKLTKTTTVKAIAIKGEDKSAVATKVYTKALPTVLPDTITCELAAELALAGRTDNVIVKGYVVAIQDAWNSQHKNVSFWMADTKDGSNTFEAYRVACETAEEAPAVGDLVWAKGTLTKYNSTPETAQGGTFGILEKDMVPAVNLGAKTIEEFLALKNKKDTCILTGVVENIKMDSKDNTQYNAYGNFDLRDETGKVYIYGLLTADGESKKFIEMNINEGDELTVLAIYAEYNGTPQVNDAIFVSVDRVPTAIDNTAVETKTFKTFENGQLVIIKNGIKYNATGAVIR